jgi:hypothetical protein
MRKASGGKVPAMRRAGEKSDIGGARQIDELVERARRVANRLEWMHHAA